MWHRGSELLDPTTILQRAGIRPGWHVADIGCGSIGHFVFPAARLVGGLGKVYAVDIQRPALRSIESAARAAQLWNIQPVWGDFERPGGIRLPDESADLTLVSNILYLAANRPGVLEEAMRLTKSGGYLLIVDWKEGMEGLGPSEEGCIKVEEALDHMQRHPVQWSDRFEAGPHHYGLLFQKEEGDGEAKVISVSNTFE